MAQQQPQEVGRKTWLMVLKNHEIMRKCMTGCVTMPPRSGLTVREEVCLDSCLLKLYNSYDYCTGVVERGGIQRNHSSGEWRGE